MTHDLAVEMTAHAIADSLIATPKGGAEWAYRLAERIVTKLETAIEMELQQKGRASAPPAEPVTVLPAPNAVTEAEGASVIVDPASTAGRMLPPNVLRPVSKSEAPVRYWLAPQLQEHILANTPQTINVSETGCVIVRNIESLLEDSSLVRLSYKLQDAVAPIPSETNVADGSPLPPMPIDGVCFYNFNCFTQEPDIQAAMAQIRKQAETMFGRRTARIQSIAPRRVGRLSFRRPDGDQAADDFPHEDV